MNLAALSIKRPIFITCIVALMLIMGGASLTKMSVDLFPDVTFPVVFVQTVYPGASPLDMEKLVSKPIEDELGSLSGLKTLKSTNSESVSFVILEFRLGTDIKNAEQQVRDRMGNLRRQLPSDVKDPVIRRFDPADQPIVRVAVSSKMDPGKLYDVVDEFVKPHFEKINGIGQVKMTGGRKREIQVLVDKKKLQDRSLSLLQISERIRTTSKDVPVGKVDSREKETVLRASGEFESVDALKNVSVNFIGSDQAVPLNQVAEIQVGLEDEKSVSTLMVAPSFERKSAIFVDVFKQSGANTVAVVDAVRNGLPALNEKMKSKGFDIQVESVRDGARPIRMNIADVRESILIGIGLCIVVVFFFLGSARSTFITGMALPNSLLGGFVIMYAMGFSINIMTLLALSLAVGLLIDDAIVVRENIFRHMEMGKHPKTAALEGTNEVQQAVVATTLVVIAVFGPIAFLDGIVGQFFKQFGLTIVFTMLISLFDAFTVAPMLSAYMATANEHHRGDGFVAKILKAFDQMQTWLEDKYESTLRYAVSHPIQILVGAGVIFVASLALLPKIPKTFLPASDTAEFYVTVEKKSGTNLAATEKLTRRVEDLLKTNPSIETLATVVGIGEAESNKASIYVHLKDRKQRNLTTSQVKEQLRAEFRQFDTEGLVNVGEVDISGGNQKAFNLDLSGEDLEQLSAYVEKLKARLEKIPGLVDVDTNYRNGKPEYHVVFDRKKSEQLGVSTVTAGSELRARVEGVVSSTYRENGREYDIRVRMQQKDRDIREQFSSTSVPNVNFNMIPLQKIAEGKEKLGYSQINRQNKARYININASLGAGGSLGFITQEVERILSSDPELKIPKGIEFAFSGQTNDFKELMINMLMAIIFGIIFIYLVLASLYESFITPYTILLALPLAMTGALVALFMFNKSIDIFSLIGIVMLLGVVAKNSILLVDYTNQLILEGVSRNDAIVRAGRTRLRPILMTSLALVAGTVPIAIGLNEASAQRTSMGIAIIGGLVSSTMLTLLVVPAAYGYVEDFKNLVRRVASKLRGSQEVEAHPNTTK